MAGHPKRKSLTAKARRRETTGMPAAQTDVYMPALWERIVAAACAVVVLVVVLVTILRKEGFSDPNKVVLIRTVLSLSVAVIGAVIPGFLHVSIGGKGVAIRAGGALALFVVTFFFSPKVLPISSAQLKELERSTANISNDLNRVLTTFKSVSVQAVYELPREEPTVVLLKECVAEITAAALKRGSPHPRGLGFKHTLYPNDKILRPPIVSIDVQHLLDAPFIELCPKLDKAVSLVRFLQAPRLRVGINREARDPALVLGGLLGFEDAPDLYLFVLERSDSSASGVRGEISFDATNDKLLVYWSSFDYPAQHWASSRKVVSIHDCDEAQFIVMLNNTDGVTDEDLDRIVANSIPRWINVRLDTHFVTFLTLHETPSAAGVKAFTATFPPVKLILEGKAASPWPG